MRTLFSSFFILFIIHCTYSQSQIIDQIIGIVGDKAILTSDVEDQYKQMLAQGMKDNPDLKCNIFEEFLIQKLLLNQAEIDSVEVNDAQVEFQLESRIKYFIDQIGSEEKLVEYFGKSILEIKEDMRGLVKDQMLTQQMQSKIAGIDDITPEEVKDFFNKLPNDSIPRISEKIELNQITIYPEASSEAIFEVREKLLKLRERILKGESFSTLAILYSEGPSSARGGEIGLASKADLDPEYSKVAFKLKEGQVSKIVESSYGFHIIQMIEKVGERVNTRHILMKPKISFEAKELAISKLDSISNAVSSDSMTFEKAALFYSEDEKTKLNGGLIADPYTLDTKLDPEQFNRSEYYIIKNLKPQEISEPFESTDEKGKTVIKIFRLKTRISPHVASLDSDYYLLKEMALQEKRSVVIEKWAAEKIKETYIKIDDSFKDCDYRIKNWFN